MLIYFVFAAFLAYSSDAKVPKQLSRTSDAEVCENMGFVDGTTSYQRAFPLIQNSTGDVVGFLPVYSDRSLQSVHTSVTTAIIFFHGSGGHANEYFCYAANASASVNGGKGIITIVPWFGNEQVTAEEWEEGGTWDDMEGSERSVRWATSSWTSGRAGSVNKVWKASKKIELTSFGALDSLIMRLLLNRDMFPNLNLITIAGFSAGGQVVQRYAWASTVGAPTTDQGASSSNVHIQFLPCSAGSYTYMSELRPAKNCIALRSLGKKRQCNTYRVPVGADDDYNSWKYGTDLSTDNGPYIDLIVDEVENRTAAYGKKNILYMFGKQDYCNCNAPNFKNAKSCFHGTTCKLSSLYKGEDPWYENCCDTWSDATTKNQLDVKASAMLQGSSRLQRGLNFVQSLSWVYGKSFKPRFSVIADMDHSVSALLASKQWMRNAFNRIV